MPIYWLTDEEKPISYWIEGVKEVTKYKKFDWIDAVFTAALLISMATLFVFSLVYWN